MSRLPALLLLAVPLRADVTKPIVDAPVQAAEPEMTVKQRWTELRTILERFRKGGGGSGPVAAYDVFGESKLPPRIFITRYASYKGIVQGLLDGLFGQEWRSSGAYWVLEKEEAVRKIVKALEIEKKEEIDHIRKSIEREMGPSMILVYRVHREDAPEEEGLPKIGPIEPPASSTGPAPGPSPPTPQRGKEPKKKGKRD